MKFSAVFALAFVSTVAAAQDCDQFNFMVEVDPPEQIYNPWSPEGGNWFTFTVEDGTVDVNGLLIEDPEITTICDVEVYVATITMTGSKALLVDVSHSTPGQSDAEVLLMELTADFANGLDIWLDDEAVANIQDQLGSGVVLSGSFQPAEFLSLLDGRPASGDYIVHLSDELGGSMQVAAVGIRIWAPDGTPEATDNCPGIYNRDQADTDGDGIGDACDPTPFGGWANLGNALAGTHGNPVLAGAGTLAANDPITLSLTNALEDTTAYLVVGLTQLNAPFKGGTLVPALDLAGFPLALPTGPLGEIPINATWPAGIPGGFTTYYQYWILDPAGPVGFSASNAISGTTP